jgi:GTP pyrophosphokinase
MSDQNLKNQTSNEIQVWLEQASKQHPGLDLELIKLACDFAQELSEDAISPYTTSTLDQGLKMASLLLDLNCDTQTLAAAIAYPGVYYAHPNRETVRQKLTPQVSKLIHGVTRMEAIHDMHKESETLNPQQVDNLRKMLLAIVDDVRVVLIKLTERLITLQYLKKCSVEQQRYIAQQALDFYAPLANRLGIGQLKWQLEDLSFRFLHNEEYFAISKELNMRRVEREEFINEMMNEITHMLNEENVQDYSLSGRAKHIYSIYKKAQRKNLPVSEIYDASALRVLVNSISDCYTTLSLAHDRWPHIDKEFDDYVANPKENGYQSIHTAVIADNQRNVEIQIRTYEMHAAAELGVAAHWKYKEGDSSPQDSYEAKIERLRELMNWQQEVSDESNADLYSSLFSDRIYAFTPQGDVFNLINGSTPLDFAYHIHSSVGHRAKGARVNDKMVPLTSTLKTGDRVEIITSKQENPSRDWMNPQLGYLTTSTAIQKVRHWFKKQNYDRDLAAGLEVWEKATRHDPVNKGLLSKVIKRFNVNKADDILVAIGTGNLGVQTVIQYIKSLSKTKEVSPAEEEISFKPAPKKSTKSNSPLIIEGVGNLLSHLAMCCKPIPGDDIIGFVTNGRGVSIHNRECKNIQHEILTRPQRIIDVEWGENNEDSAYPIDLTVVADDRSGLVRDISAIIAGEKLHFLGLSSHINKSSNEAIIQITIELRADVTIDYIRNQILQVDGVLKVTRN